MTRFRQNFRDKQEWLKSVGMNLRTCSDTAAKEYDMIVTELLGWYENVGVGGQACLDRMIVADPEFLLGRALEIEMNLLGCLNSPKYDKTLAKKVEQFKELVEKKKDQANEQELLHAEVVEHYARNDLKRASVALERLITLYPQDMAAVKICQDTYFFLGQARGMRQSMANCMSKLEAKKDPLAGYAHGMYSFALEESNMYPQAEEQASKAIDLIPWDTWAIHSYAHCKLMLSQHEEGYKWLADKMDDWQGCQKLGCHQRWHMVLFEINRGNYQEAVRRLDEECIFRCVDERSTLPIHDACSMVYRMELADIFAAAKGYGCLNDVEGASSRLESHLVEEDKKECKERWLKLYDVCKAYKGQHLNGFNDAHYMMSYLGNDDLATAREHIDSIDQEPDLIEGQQVVKPLLEAMYEYKVGNFASCVDLLLPIRHDIVRIGGSHAQRDVFEWLLTVAASKSERMEHYELAKRLIRERDLMAGHHLPETQLLDSVPGHKRNMSLLAARGGELA